MFTVLDYFSLFPFDFPRIGQTILDGGAGEPFYRLWYALPRELLVVFLGWGLCIEIPSVLWHCQLNYNKGV